MATEAGGIQEAVGEAGVLVPRGERWFARASLFGYDLVK